MLEFGLTMLIDFVFCILLSFELPFESCLSVFSYLWVHLYTSNGLSYALAFSFIGVVTSILSIEWKFGGAHFLLLLNVYDHFHCLDYKEHDPLYSQITCNRVNFMVKILFLGFNNVYRVTSQRLILNDVALDIPLDCVWEIWIWIWIWILNQ